jgi:DNA-binding response OmpR family regulator
VDDDELFRPMLHAMLERSGFAVEAVNSGNEALARYRENPADLVITDLIMPDKEGLETIRELRAEAPGVKIIAMSGGGRTSTTTYLQLAGRLGAAKVLSKPFSQQELLDAITTVLAGD